MTSPSEIFVVQLARASKRANRFVRDLQPEDRKDVIAAAILWCWENQHNYSLTVTLDQWFMGAVRNAYRDWLKGEVRNSAEVMDQIPTGDTTAAAAAAQEAAEALILALPPAYKKVAKMQMQGYTRAEMIDRGIEQYVVDSARARIKQLRKLLPDSYEYRRALRTLPTKGSDDVNVELSNIDRELEELEFAPPAGRDCPPCWRCKWFEGFLPGARTPVRMPIVEPDVATAVRDTEQRKIEIAKEVRNGNL